MVGQKDLPSLVQDASWPQSGAGSFGSITFSGTPEADTAKLQTAAFEGWAALTGQPLRSLAESSSTLRPLPPLFVLFLFTNSEHELPRRRLPCWHLRRAVMRQWL